MEFLKYGAIAVVALSFLVILFFALKSRKPFRFLLINAAIGIFALTVINFTARYTGVYIPINTISVSASSVFGIPALCGMVVLQMICI